MKQSLKKESYDTSTRIYQDRTLTLDLASAIVVDSVIESKFYLFSVIGSVLKK